MDGGRQRADNVEVVFPESNVVGPPLLLTAPGMQRHHRLLANSLTLVEKAIAALPPALGAQVSDPKRKARSQDPGWKFSWPYSAKKVFAQCIFCMKVVPAGIKRFKQHLSDGFGDAIKCPRALEFVSKEMYVYLKRNSKVLIDLDVEEGEKEKEALEPSSGTKYKHAKKKVAQAVVSSFTVSGPPKPTKSVSAMLCKSPEQVVAERHKNKTSHPTLEYCSRSW
jgi:hypothetical protein